MQIFVLLHVFCASPHGLKFPKGLAIVNVPSLEQSPRDPLRGYDLWKMLNTVFLKSDLFKRFPVKHPDLKHCMHWKSRDSWR